MPSSTPVRDVMSAKVVTLRPDQTVEQAADVGRSSGCSATRT